MNAWVAQIKHLLHRWWLQAVMAVLCVAGMTGCSTVPAGDPQLPPPVHAIQIAQIQEGSRLRFVVCQTCPERTPKTLGGHAAAAVSGGEPDARIASGTPGRSYVLAPVALLATVHFDFASAAITARTRAALDALRPLLGMGQDIAITGYTDNIGPKDVNVELASDRAQAVIQALAEPAGPAADSPERQAMEQRARPRISGSTAGKALCCYLRPNESEEGRATNRRAELTFTVPRTDQAEHAIARASHVASLRDVTDPALAPASAVARPATSTAQPR